MDSIRKLLFIIAISPLLASCMTSPSQKLSTDANQYFQNLSQLCGKTFVGNTHYPKDPGHDFAGKTLTAYFKSCTETEIRIPFTVGEDKSRTWIISKTDKGLLLKHDHRHKDGTPDEITMYGGYAGEYKEQSGTEFQQFFKADLETAQLIPAAETNVWMIELKPEDLSLVYYLERHLKPRYKAILKQK